MIRILVKPILLSALLLQFGFAAQKPNVVCILVDDLGYSDLSSFGGKDIKTPAIDKLMNSGMRMNQFYSNCTVCTPTRASLLTGRSTWSYSSKPGIQLGVFQSYRAYSSRAYERGRVSHRNDWKMAPRL